MSKWEMVRLGEVFSSIRNGANIKQGMISGGYPITRIETISNCVIDRNRMGYAGIKEISSYKGYVLEHGDILMSHINSEKHLGKTACYELKDKETIIHGMNLLCLKVNTERLFYKFANYFFGSLLFKQQIPRITKKSVNQASFTVTALKQLLIPLPPLEVQRKIAQTLDAAAALLALRKEQLAEMDNLIKSVFYEMFGDPVTNEKGWKKKHLGEVSCVKIGPFGSLLHREDYIKGGIPLINPSHIIDGKICPDVNLTVREEMAQQLSQYRMDSKSVILGRRGEIGRCAVVGEKEEGFLCGTGSLLISSLRDLNPVFLFKLISTTQLKNELENVAQGVTMKNLNSKIVEKFEVPVPPLPLQTQFAEIVTKIEEQKALVQKAIDESQYLFDSLMNEYFN